MNILHCITFIKFPLNSFVFSLNLVRRSPNMKHYRELKSGRIAAEGIFSCPIGPARMLFSQNFIIYEGINETTSPHEIQEENKMIYYGSECSLFKTARFQHILTFSNKITCKGNVRACGLHKLSHIIDNSFPNHSDRFFLDFANSPNVKKVPYFHGVSENKRFTAKKPPKSNNKVPCIAEISQKVLQQKSSYIKNTIPLCVFAEKKEKNHKSPGNHSENEAEAKRHKNMSQETTSWILKRKRLNMNLIKLTEAPGRLCFRINAHLSEHKGVNTRRGVQDQGVDLQFGQTKNEQNFKNCSLKIKSSTSHTLVLVDQTRVRGTNHIEKCSGHIERVHQSFPSTIYFLFIIMCYFKTKVEYTESSMNAANAYLRRIRSVLQNSYAYINGQLKCAPIDEPLVQQALADARIRISRSLADDFDTVRAMDAVMDLIAVVNKQFKTPLKVGASGRSSGTMVAVSTFIHNIMKVFGVNLLSLSDASPQSIEKSGRLSKVMNSVVDFRHEVRAFALLQDEESLQKKLSSSEKKVHRKERIPLLESCDSLRDDLLKAGLHIKDHAGGSSWNITDEPAAVPGYFRLHN
ncbi:unnamed protein product, partial [Meganyctiphanes norvegica]